MAEQRIHFKLPLRQGGSRIKDVQYRIDNGEWVKTLQTHSPITIPNLEYGQAYEIELRAVNETGASPPSSPVVVTPTTVPDAPTIDSLSVDGNNLSINFTLPLNDGGESITDIEYQIGGQRFKSSGSTSSPITIENLSDGIRPIRIRAINKNGSSQPSNQLIETIVSQGVTISNISSSNSTVEINYNTENIDTINTLEVSTDGGSSWSVEDVANPLVISITEEGTYDIRLRVNSEFISNITQVEIVITIEPQLEINNVTSDSNDISVEYETEDLESINKLEYTEDGGQSWGEVSIGSPLVINRGSFDPISLRLRINDNILSNQTSQARTYNPVQGGLRFTPPVIGSQTGSYGIHGVTDDTNLSPPSLEPDDWELLSGTHDPIVHHLDTIGKRKIDPVGFYLTNDNLSLFYNSGWDDYTDYRGGTHGFDREATNQAGSLIAFDGTFNHQDFDTNPVLSFPQYTWQGQNRVNPYALVWYPPHNCFYCWYGDFAEGGDGDKYSGRRALGLAKSTDMINWIYVSVEEPAFDIEDVYNIIPSAFPNTNFNSEGRLYAFGATYVDGNIYLNVGGSIDEQNWSAILTSSDPTSEWSGIDNPNMNRPMPIKIGDKWYSPRNIGSPNDGDKRAIAIRVYDDLNSDGVNHFIFDTGHNGSAGVSRQLFAYNGKWHVAYRQRDEDLWELEEEDFRDMYIAREK